VDREQLSQIRTHTADGRVESTLTINSCRSLNSYGRSDMVFRNFDGYLVMSLVLFGVLLRRAVVAEVDRSNGGAALL
jgi:hypothetical protein